MVAVYSGLCKTVRMECCCMMTGEGVPSRVALFEALM